MPWRRSKGDLFAAGADGSPDETIGVGMLPTMLSGNCFNGPQLISGKKNVKSESFWGKYIKSENSKNKSNWLTLFALRESEGLSHPPSFVSTPAVFVSQNESTIGLNAVMTDSFSINYILLSRNKSPVPVPAAGNPQPEMWTGIVLVVFTPTLSMNSQRMHTIQGALPSPQICPVLVPGDRMTYRVPSSRPILKGYSHGRRPVRVSLETAAPPVFGKEGGNGISAPPRWRLFLFMTEASCITGTYDAFNRRVNYLRISVTDRCNLRCTYCSDGEIPHLRHQDILSYEEIERVTRAAAELGVSHVRLTGGEPLVRPYVSNLIELLTAVPGIEDISLTTNGTLLKDQAEKLKGAGLKRINISLDSLRPERFASITCGDKLDAVLEGIAAAHRVGLSPVKINMVVMPGVNDDEVIDFALKARDKGWHVRYIEHMPFGGSLGKPVLTVAEIKDRIESALGDLWPCCVNGAGPANYFSFGFGQGTVGFIRPVSHRFCGHCNRLRLTADGKLRPCLLNDLEIDIKADLRGGAGTEELKALLRQAITAKPEHHYLEEAGVGGRQMRQIGG